MHTGSNLAARALLILGLVACGDGSPPEGSQVGLRFVRAALLSDASSVELRFYGEGTSCVGLQAARPRPPPLLGPFIIPLDDETRANGATFETDRIPAGTYAVLADALDAGGAPVGSGCAPSGRVRNRERSIIEVTISD